MGHIMKSTYTLCKPSYPKLPKSFAGKPWSNDPTGISKTYLTFNFYLIFEFSPLCYRQLISRTYRGSLSF